MCPIITHKPKRRELTSERERSIIKVPNNITIYFTFNHFTLILTLHMLITPL